MVVSFLGERPGVTLPVLGFGRVGLGVKESFTYFGLILSRSSLGTRGLDSDLVASSLFTPLSVLRFGILS